MPGGRAEDQPGAGGHDRAVANERWRPADLPMGDPAAPASRDPVTGVTP
jgi:hypothetical protein